MARLVKFERTGEMFPIYINPEAVVSLERGASHDVTNINVLPQHWMHAVKGTPEETRAALEREP